MSEHRFRVGDIVGLAPSFLSQTAKTQLYEIVRLLPERDGELQYRVKGVDDPLERMVRESELISSGGVPAGTEAR